MTQRKMIFKRYKLALPVLFLLCVLGAKGQAITDFNGVWYIASNGNAYQAGTTTNLPYQYNSDIPESNFYLRPAANPQLANETDAFYDGTDETMPFLTTNNNIGHDDVALWKVQSSGDGYYYIIHAASNKYVVYRPYYTGGNSRRKAMHLETWSTPPDEAKFEINSAVINNVVNYSFRPKSVTSGHCYWNLADRNQPCNYGTNAGLYYGGLLGLYQLNNGVLDINSRFQFEPYQVPTPTISYDYATSEFTITSSVDGATIYYTTNGDTPTTSLTPYTSPVTFIHSLSETDVIKAIAVKYGVSSEVAVFTMEQSARPFIVVNQSTYQATITGVAGATVYYTTTVGEEPTTLYEGTITLGYEFSGGVVRAIAVEDGKLPSDVTEIVALFKCKTPQINVNYNTERISLSCEDQTATLYYTLDGSEPDEESTPYTGPFTVPDVGVYTVKAKAFRTNYNPSATATTQVEKLVAPTIQADASLTHITITASDGVMIYYTNNGSTPTTGSFPYTEPLDYSFSLQPIKAIAYKANAFRSAVASNSIQLKCPIPEIYPDFETNLVNLYCDAADATMYYTVDGSDPTTSSTVTQYDGTPFPLPESGTIKAYATRPNCYPSDIATYALDKAATPTIQADADDKYITITTATIGAAIYYTIDGSEPDPDNNPNTIRYVGPFREGPNHERVSDVEIKAIAVKTDLFWSDVAAETVMLKCDAPRIVHSDEYEFTFSCPFPTSGTQVYYTEDGTEATSSSTLYSTPVTVSQLPLAEAFHARAYAEHYLASDETIKTFSTSQLDGDGDDAHPYLIESDYEYRVFVAMANGEYPGAHYKLIADIDASGSEMVGQTFTGMFESGSDAEGNFYSISNLDHPMFREVNPGVNDGSFPTNQGIVRNVVLKDVNISNHTGNTGAIAGMITGGACIYNCGILSGEVGGTGNVGGIVGLLDYTPYNYPNERYYSLTRVINCYSYADITSKGADGNNYWAAGVVGNNNYESSVYYYPYQNNDCKFKTAVINCMFYGDITTQCGSNIAPVFGNKRMSNLGAQSRAINRYDYFLVGAEFANSFNSIDQYKATWPAEEKYLTQYEYYRSILNSNRLLCTSYVTGKKGDQVYQDTACIAKWVRDESIAPYPILKKWGKYPSVINLDPVRVWDTATDRWIYRAYANDYEGKSFSTLSVSVKPGDHALNSLTNKSLALVITDMDTLRGDYGYYKVQLPYYNEVFGNVNSTDHAIRYGGNYTDWVVTGWKITKVNGQASGATTFVENWEHGYNFADRNDKFRDLYCISGRVYAQGGFYYVPEGVTSIEIEAYWGKACYLRNKEQSIDRVSVTNPASSGGNLIDYGFLPSGNLSSTFQGHTVYDNLQSAIASLGSMDDYPTVYDQAIVLVGNLQVLNKNKALGTNLDGVLHPFTIMSADFDLDNEPDYCFQFQFRDGLKRWPIQPIRFDFLAIPELGMAVRHDANAYAIGIFVPQGHFEITETAFMHTTQFEYEGFNVEDFDGSNIVKIESPLILNGGQFEQIVVRYSTNSVANHTSYILMGGHFRMKRFTPGAHTNRGESTKVRLCAVNCIGGEYPEFYLSGIYRPDIDPNVSYFGVAGQGNPHCYTNGGKFGTICGAGYDKILGDVTFKIDHSIIGEFYGGGINAACPVGGSIDVTIDHSLVGKYCGGPKVGTMATGKTVTTSATGTTFGQFYGGGNGGTNYYREQAVDGNSWTMPPQEWNAWESLHVSTTPTIVYNPNNPNLGFNPLNTRSGKDKIYNATKGYHDIFEFEVFNASNGLAGDNPTIRTYVHWAQFGATRTGDVTSTLTDCVVLQDFYGGGNLGFVDGNAVSTLQGNTIIYGSAFGGGYSAAIPKFRCYDLSRAIYPTRDYSGVMHNGQLETEEIPYVQDGDGNNVYYEWINEIPADWTMPSGFSLNTDNPVFEYPANSGNWYCYTTESLENLGVVHGNTVLNVNGNTKIYGRKKSEVGDEPDPEALEFAGAAYGGGNESDVMGNSKVSVSGTAGLLVSNVYGGGNISVTHGNSEVEIIKGTIGVHTNGVPRPGSGRVFGGGKGAYDEDAYENGKHLGDVLGNSSVIMRGGKVLSCLYGGCELANVGRTYEVEHEGHIIESPVAGTGQTHIIMKGGEVGFERTHEQIINGDQTLCYVFGGGRGNPDVAFNTWTNVNSAIVSIEGGTVWGSVFGGGEDGHVLDSIQLNVSQDGNNVTRIGSCGTSNVDGNIFGGGRGYETEAKTAGSTGGNITVNIRGGHMLGNVYGGGRMGSVGIFFSPTDDEVHYGVMRPDSDTTSHGHIKVNITGGEIGYDIDPAHPYEPSPEGHPEFAERVGNVFGGGMGLIDVTKLEYARVKTTEVNIGGDAYIWGNVYGGGKMGKVRDSVNVVIGGNATVRLRAFAGGKGYDDEEHPNSDAFIHAADVGEAASATTPRHGLARITLQDNAKVQVCLYGGAQVANIQGNAHVTLKGGELGRRRTLSEITAHPTHCYVFGGGQGNPKNGKYNEWTNVDTAFVNIQPGTRVFGSVFGGGEDGHVLEDIYLDIELGANDTIGTHGYSKVDGNIFSGGRGFHPQALTAGGTRGNIHTHIHGGGHILGSVFGGGRIASTGIYLLRATENGIHPGDTIADIPDDPETPENEARRYGYTNILIEGNVIIGHDYNQEELDGVMQSFKIGDIGGNVYGGAMGDDVAPTTVAGRMGHVKQTEILIKDNVWVKGTVNGGGESGHVWKDTKVTIEGNATIGVDRVGENHQPVDSLVYSGNVFGGSWGSDSLLWVNEGRVYGNTTVLIKGGHIRNNVYGGGEYASVGTYDTLTDIHGQDSIVSRGGHCTVIMDGGELGPLDMSGLNAYVFGGGKGVGEDTENEYKHFGQVYTTYVQIKDNARVFGSIFGGGEDGHVTDTVLVEINGGTIGTTGLTTWDGNIFGGGRNYSAANLAAGRVGGNIKVNITDGHMYGSVFGGGRLASVGVDEDGNVYEHHPDAHGHTFVTISGGVIGYPHEGECGNDNIRGHVYGGCKGIVKKPLPTSVDPSLLGNVVTTNVLIREGATIKGSVFGGGEDGHVLSNTNVMIEGGTIGDDEGSCDNKHHGNVFGGGRGIGLNENNQYSPSAGNVNGNALVTITGGHINRNVYGGGFLASVGMRDASTFEPDSNTGWARVKISGGVIGTDSNEDIEHGNVFGSCRGVAGSEYQNFAYVNNALVTLTTGDEVIKGSIFGSGEDGHVLINTQVTINGGQVGMANVDNPYKGNVYGGGRGIDVDENGSLSPTAGLVKGNTKVSVQAGRVYGDVFGGGNASSVWGDKLVDVLSVSAATSPVIFGNVFGGCKAVPASVAMDGFNKGLKTVNVRGGLIKGNVYGCSYSSIDGDPSAGHEKDWTSFVNIDGGTINGNVHGAGWSGEVKGSVCINIGANAIVNGEGEPRNVDNFRFNDNGGLSIVTFGHVRDINVEEGTATFTGFLVDEGVPRGSEAPERGFCWSTTPHPTVDNDTVYIPSLVVGDYTKEVTGLVENQTYYIRAYAKNMRGEVAYSPEEVFTMTEDGASELADEQPTNDYHPIYEPSAKNLHIKGSVYGGSDHMASQASYLNNWLSYFDITGYSNIYIDGTGYDTQTTDTLVETYMNIGEGLFGSSTHCESGREGRNILLTNYGLRTETGNVQMQSATRTLTTIQRCDNLVLDNANVNITGMPDLDVGSGYTGHYAVHKVDSVLYLANASSLVLSHETSMPSHMDSIYCLRSVRLMSGTVYDQKFFKNLPWEWIGINGGNHDHPEYAHMYYTTTDAGMTTPLAFDQENVILFNKEARLWVRYTVGTITKYGELQGFIRMISPFNPYGKDSFAYARPKLTDKNNPIVEGSDLNKSDGGFLSYQTNNNFFTQKDEAVLGFTYPAEGDDGGTTFTNTKQYPYFNVGEVYKADGTLDMQQYREWVFPKLLGKQWYVDGRGIGTGGWGQDKNHQEGWGHFPDKPKLTVSADMGICYDGFSNTSGSYETFDPEDDLIYVVGPVSAVLEKENLNRWPDEYTLRLYRYPGGHAMSNEQKDATVSTDSPYPPSTTPTSSSYDGLASGVTAGPGANLGALVNVNKTGDDVLVMSNVEVDGLYRYVSVDAGFYSIPTTFRSEQEFINEPLVVTQPNSTLTMNDGTVLERGYNAMDGDVWYSDSDYQPEANVHHGGALYVDKDATVNVNDLLIITDNYQKKGATVIKSNVFLPTFPTHLNITDELDEATRIGITSPIRNKETEYHPYDYRYNTLSPIAVATTVADAQSAWEKSNFSDDLNWFFVNGHSNATPRTTYYASSIPDYPSNTGFIPDKTLFFGWTWNNVVRKSPDATSSDVDYFDFSNIDSPDDLAWLISLANGLNGKTANSLSGVNIEQKNDIDLEQYVWLPIGSNSTGAEAFSGNYDGRGHLIENLYIDYVGKGDRRYERSNYGLFGSMENGTVNRTFAISGLIRPVGLATIGGLVGSMKGANATVSNSESAVTLYCPSSNSDMIATGGLVGNMMDGEIYSSMAMSEIHATYYYTIGGLVGCTGAIDGSDDGSVHPKVNNSFANMKLTFDDTPSIYAIGGLIGYNRKAVMRNSYAELQSGSTTPAVTNFAVLVGDNHTTVDRCYGFEQYDGRTYDLTKRTGSSEDPNLSNSYRYTPVMDADNLGYMYYDNTVTIDDEQKGLFKRLNEWVDHYNSSGNDYKYSYWSRPAIPEINGDMPVLHLCNGDTGIEGDGDFRSLATYHNGAALQYGGEVRDGDDDQFGSMLARSESIFVYGDVEENLLTATVNATKISIYEHASVLHPGRLSTFPYTYVGITFDNSHQNGMGTSTPGVNYGLNGLGVGPYPLPRDWHMFSSPLSNAPIGFDYKDHNDENLYTGGDYSITNFYNNPWVSNTNEFSWLQSDGSNNVRYWMKGWENSQSQRDPDVSFNASDWEDGYFPSSVRGAFSFGQGLIEGADEEDRYPYGMDFYTWTEPDYHWINFKRNGPNHWHSDANESTGHHDHINYEPVADATRNVNEESLIEGRGYMAAICDTTFMQSHGRLNAGNDLGIVVTKSGSSKVPGMNLVGNTYHAYLDFDKLASVNSGLIDASYVVYDADQYTDYAESAFHFYPSGGSKGGAYADQYLHPHQGFFVLAKGGGDLSFTEDMLVTRQNSKFRDWHPNYPLVNLFLSSNNGCSDVTVIEFDRPEWGGAVKLKQLRQGNGVFYAQHNNTHYSALFTTVGTERVPLWFEAKEDDIYTIKWNTANGDFQSMYLIDNIAGVRYDMLENDSYTFQGHVGDYPSRFYITFSVTDVEENVEDNTFVFFDGSQWVVTGEGQLEFIDLQGQVLWKKQVYGGQNRVGLPDVACGMYLFRLTNGMETKVQKVIVNKEGIR